MTRKRDELLDHEADGIREFDNDLPRWWLYGFYFTIVVGVLYFVNFHVLPKPVLGGSVKAEYEAEMRAAAAAHPSVPVAPAGAATAGPAATVERLTDPASLSAGDAIFHSQTNPCTACHRPDLGGLVGPNLTDEYWLHGCSMGDIVHTITAGYADKGMLPYGGGPALTARQVQELASFILSKQDSHPPNPKPRDPTRDVECTQESH